MRSVILASAQALAISSSIFILLKSGTAYSVVPTINTAEVASLSEQDRIRFEAEWKGYLDTMSCLEMAEERGVKNVAKSMKTDGVDYAVISKYTNLTIAEIDKL